MPEAQALRPYEGVILMHPDTTEAQQKDFFRKNKTIIESFSGKVNHVDTWGKRNLANPIKGQKRAIYFYTTFEGGIRTVHELERTMRINDRVLRFSHLRLEDETNLAKHVERFHDVLAESINREKEREAKFQARKKI